MAYKSNGRKYGSTIQHELIFLFIRSYFKGVDLGYLTKDPAAYHDPHVCDKYVKKAAGKRTHKAHGSRRLGHARRSH